MDRNRVHIVLLLACLGALTACSPASKPAPPAGNGAVIVLPDRTECSFAGRGATLTYQGKRLNYTCGDGRALMGDVVIANGTEMTVEKVQISGPTIAHSVAETFFLEAIQLADGTLCLNAGPGATLAFDGKRLNYTCGDSTLGLIGDIVPNGAIFIAELAQISGTELESSKPVEVTRLSAVAP